METVFEKRYSEKEAAALLQISAMTIRRLRERGNLGYYQLGRRVFISEKHISDFLKSSEKNSSSGEEK